MSFDEAGFNEFAKGKAGYAALQAGARRAWEKAQRDAEIAQLGRLDPVKVTDAFQSTEAKLKIATEALERVAENGGSRRGMGWTAAQEARIALAKLRGEG